MLLFEHCAGKVAALKKNAVLGTPALQHPAGIRPHSHQADPQSRRAPVQPSERLTRQGGEVTAVHERSVENAAGSC